MENKTKVEDFEDLPRRIFLDSSIMQILTNYGEFIWEGATITKDAKIRKVTNGLRNLNALHQIMFVNQRANFEFAVSENSIKEVMAKHDKFYLNYSLELLEHWINFADYYEDGEMFTGKGYTRFHKVDKKMFGYLSKKDKLLIFDAVKLECDVFLTLEEKLAKNAKHIEDNLNLTILRPFEYWKMLRPWAAIWA